MYKIYMTILHILIDHDTFLKLRGYILLFNFFCNYINYINAIILTPLSVNLLSRVKNGFLNRKIKFEDNVKKFLSIFLLTKKLMLKSVLILRENTCWDCWKIYRLLKLQLLQTEK